MRPKEVYFCQKGCLQSKELLTEHNISCRHSLARSTYGQYGFGRKPLGRTLVAALCSSGRSSIGTPLFIHGLETCSAVIPLHLLLPPFCLPTYLLPPESPVFPFQSGFYSSSSSSTAVNCYSKRNLQPASHLCSAKVLRRPPRQLIIKSTKC